MHPTRMQLKVFFCISFDTDFNKMAANTVLNGHKYANTMLHI